MRFIAALLFLLTPLQPVAAVAFCVAAERASGHACEPGMGEMSGHVAGKDDGRPVSHPATSHTGLALWSVPQGTTSCGTAGLCSAPPPTVTPTVTAVAPERPADLARPSSTSDFGPGTRPAPPPHPPRA